MGKNKWNENQIKKYTLNEHHLRITDSRVQMPRAKWNERKRAENKKRKKWIITMHEMRLTKNQYKYQFSMIMIHPNGINYAYDEKHIKSQVILNMCILWSLKPIHSASPIISSSTIVVTRTSTYTHTHTKRSICCRITENVHIATTRTTTITLQHIRRTCDIRIICMSSHRNLIVYMKRHFYFFLSLFLCLNWCSHHGWVMFIELLHCTFYCKCWMKW